MHVHAHASEGVGGNALVPLNKSGNLVIVIAIFCHQINIQMWCQRALSTAAIARAAATHDARRFTACVPQFDAKKHANVGVGAIIVRTGVDSLSLFQYWFKNLHLSFP